MSSNSQSIIALNQTESLAMRRQVFAADLKLIQPCRQRFANFLSEMCLPETDIQGWSLVFNECVANAIRHGSNNDSSKEISVEWRAEDNEIVLAVSDSGNGPDPTREIDPSLPEDPLSESGRGLFIISTFCDRADHWRSQSGYRIVLHKKHHFTSPEFEVNDDMTMVLDELSRAYECMSAFHRLGMALIGFDRPSQFMQQSIDNLALLYSPQPDFILLCLSNHVLPPVAEELQFLPAICTLDEAPKSARKVIENGGSFIWESGDDVVREVLLCDYQNGCCFPIVANGQTLGALIVGHAMPQPHGYRDSALGNLRTFCDLIGIALANSNLQVVRNNEQRALREMEIAADIQRNLLPILPPPVSDDWTITLRHKCAYEVAGDYLEARFDHEGNLVMAVIDVMGKGVSAAMLATIFRTAFHMNLEKPQSLEGFMQSLNHSIHEQLNRMTMFMTCGLIRISKDLSTMEVCNAGHCPVMIVKENGDIEEIEASASPLGIFDELSVETATIPLEGSESVLMVTDGLYEWNAGDDWWGWENLREFARENLHNPENFWDQLQETIRVHGAAGGSRDDQTMLCWKLHN